MKYDLKHGRSAMNDVLANELGLSVSHILESIIA